MWPAWIDLFLLLDSSFAQANVGALLLVGERTEDVLLDHVHDELEVRDDIGHDRLLVTQHRLKVIYRCQSFRLKSDRTVQYLSLHISRLVIVVVSVHASLHLLYETISRRQL